ncbi:iron-siderophore ABC transporter substrate-binding protein [Ilumatobacter nonamiensis]|uniref:iron-siderophore ABC transporter substrate-binding protein n=1 Tax=Ilumatobacter nonamiensis TaxID=467093 RepID=UPI00034617E9|nr:iron-siderophore ABC transporter substrate-binding protein [Ilumatobacter nonamiensis]
MQRSLHLLVAGAVALAVVACGSDDSTSSSTDATTDGSTEPTPPAESTTESVPSTDGESAESAESTVSTPAGAEPDTAGFPATVETAFGEVTVDEQPERVVALGWGDAETALALGVQPVGAADWLGFGGEGVGPWAAGLYDAPPELITVAETPYEAIAALDPDLILNVRSGGDAAEHDLLTEIAPTIGIPEGGDAFLTSQEQQVTMIAAALGQPEAGQALLDEIDAQFEAVRDAHPDWAGQTVSAATRFGDQWGAYVDGEGRLEFLKSLGFEQNPAVAELDASGGFYAELSGEELNVLDADLIVAFPIQIETTEITGDPIFGQIPAVADGRSVIVDGDLSDAYSINTTLSTAYTLENIVPLISEAIDR